VLSLSSEGMKGIEPRALFSFCLAPGIFFSSCGDKEIEKKNVERDRSRKSSLARDANIFLLGSLSSRERIINLL
jgi:hypothetical protein